MTSEQFRERLYRRARSLGGDVREDIIKGYNRLKKMLGDRGLTALVESGSLDRLFDQQDLRRAFAELEATVQQGVGLAGQLFIKDVPGGGVFNTLNPNVIVGIETLNDQALRTLEKGIREGVRKFVARGLREGVNPRTIARGLRDMIGLAPNQVDAVANYRGLLESGDRDALKRELRDARFDKMIERAFDGDGLTATQIDKMVDVYQRNFVAFNAETNARTIALDAQKLGNHLSWQDAIDRGDVSSEEVTKRWSGTLDDREREEHLAMEGETVPWDEEFSNGQMLPGDNEFNCRCVPIYSTRETVGPGAGAAGVESGRLNVADAL